MNTRQISTPQDDGLGAVRAIVACLYIYGAALVLGGLVYALFKAVSR